MSETEFKKAKSELAFSQQLVDQMRAQKGAAPMAEEAPEEAPEPMVEEVQEAPQEEVQEEAQEQRGILDAVKETVQAGIDQIKSLLKGKESEKEDDEVEMPREEAIKEHEQLVDVLESPSHEDDKKEAEKQEEELEEYKGEEK